MELLVFGRTGKAYLVPKHIIKEAEIRDKRYDEIHDDDDYDFFINIQNKYKEIKIGHVLSGDIS
jgi:hypothetical protein